MGWDGLGWDGMGWDRFVRYGFGWVGTGWDVIRFYNMVTHISCYFLLATMYTFRILYKQE